MNGVSHVRQLSRRAVVCGLAGVVVPSADALAQPRPDAWRRWSSSNDGNRDSIDHRVWAVFLSRYTVSDSLGVVRLPYSRISAEDRQVLAGYIGVLERTTVSALRRTEQLAYWINLYNALTAKVVLDHYPVKSIRDIRLGGGLTAAFFGGPWDAKLLRIEDQLVSLNDIEHRILRPLWSDPRLHYVPNCASTSCPALPRQPLTAATADEVMSRAASSYVNGAYGVRRQGGDVWVSSIYRWYREDFGGTDATVLAHLARYAAGDLATTLARGARIVNDFYDWSLNDAP
jgi:hypothetical protein